MVMRLVCDLQVSADPRDDFPAEPVSALPCLWSHVLYLFDEPEGPDLPGLAPVADEERVEVRLGGGVVRPGLGSSYVAGADDAVHARCVRVLALVSAYYAALADVDRRMFSYLAAWRRRGPSGGTAGPSDRLFEEVSLFQAVLQTLDLHLAASTAFDVRVWTAMTRVWRMEAQLTALTSKLELLRTFQERQIERSGLAKSQRLTLVALAFTVLSFLGVLLDLVQFGQESPLVSPEPWRTALSVLFVGAVGLAFALGVSRRER
jgi:hypothetical protein